MSNCRAVTPAGVSDVNAVVDVIELFGNPPPASKLMLVLMMPWFSSAGGGNAGAAYARDRRKAANSFIMNVTWKLYGFQNLKI